MKPPAAKGKTSQLDRSRSSRRAPGPSPSYLKTRIMGSRLFAAAHILAIAELTRRLHQAYQHAYDKQAADRLLPQNPDREGIRNLVNETLAIDPCAQFAERILTAVSSRANPALGGGDLFSVFALFLNNGGQYTRTLPPGSAGWGNPIGLISSRGGAKIAMASFPDPTLQTWSDAGTVIAELFHLAGTKAHYTDKQLAKAAHGIPEYAAQMSLSAGHNVFHPKYTGNPRDPKDGGYSSYFHNIAGALCPVAKR